MSYFLVENEGDLENTLSYTVDVARRAAHKVVDIEFSSGEMMHIFMVNLFNEFTTEGIDPDNGLHLNMLVPEM
jgi:hypothetical protein|tara:strand:- start:283 stop:501 length:219 start_codon:yes stop_codon:yes gene_type:complete